MKVFQINEYDCWAGEDFESVIDAYCKEIEISREEALDGSEHELSEEEMAKRMFWIDDEDDLRAHGEDPARVTCIEIPFSAQLEWMEKRGEKFPCLFATTLE